MKITMISLVAVWIFTHVVMYENRKGNQAFYFLGIHIMIVNLAE
ncbi:hypothetical protein OCB14_18000 [Bacillus cereus]|nr:hypothetical protein [Bacillus cereus]